MVFSQQCYSVLIVSNSVRFNQVITDLLPPSNYEPIRIVSSLSAAKRAALERSYDFIILNAPLQNEMGTAFAISQSGNRETVVLILIPAAMQDQIHNQVVDRGVFTLSKPTSPQVLATALRWMTSSRERLRRIGEETQSMEQKMREIHLLNRAKLLLTQHRGMTEEAAHYYLEKQAMDRCITKHEVVTEVIESYERILPT